MIKHIKISNNNYRTKLPDNELIIIYREVN